MKKVWDNKVVRWILYILGTPLIIIWGPLFIIFVTTKMTIDSLIDRE